MKTNFKKTLLGLAALAAGAGVMSACSTIESKLPSELYDQKLVSFEDGKNDIYNNKLGNIYDAIVNSGDTNSARVLNNILYMYAEATYAPFFGEGGLHEAIDAHIDGDDTKLNAILAEYPIYEGKAYKAETIHLGFINKIHEAFHGYVNNSSYQVREHFKEELFYDAQLKNYYDLETEESYGKVPYNQDAEIRDGAFRLSEDYPEVESAGMYLDGQGTTRNAYFLDIFGVYEDYINRALLPDIYRSELVSNYLQLENTSQLMMTPARHIDYISLSDNAAYPNAVQDLMKAYCDKVINAAGVDAEKFGFTFLADLYKGTTARYYDGGEMEAMMNSIYDAAGWTIGGTIDIVGYGTVAFTKQSTLGTYAENYSKLTDNRITDDSSIRSDFTSNGTYTVETGLAIKYGTLLADSSKTNTGWYTSSSNLSGLSSKLSTRLFQVQVANEVGVPDANLLYGKYINGLYYMMPTSYETGAENPFLVYDGGSWYICRVDAASKYAKLASEGEGSYTDEEAEHIINIIGHSLASNETFKTSANKYYVDAMAAVYHDSYVYDYFKNTFPDLFK
ncbi:MAG: hypothetical protein K5694_04925 [Bacilli bacterium]|nr:hypothetical protein [Bacilli bacterium]